MTLPIPAKIQRYAKTVVAVAALAGVLAKQIVDGHLDLEAIFAALAALGVYAVPNK